MGKKIKYLLGGLALLGVVIATTIATQMFVFGTGGKAAQVSQTSQAEMAENLFPAWAADATYIAGDKVFFAGKVYEAKWWTRGEKPTDSNEWGVWKSVIAANPAAAGISDDASARAGEKGFKIVGYYPDWQPEKTGQIQYENLTHINYAFAIPMASGELRPLEHPQAAKQIIAEAHKRGVKVLLAVGGWAYQGVPIEGVFQTATSTDEKCEIFAQNIIRMVKTYGFDGVDVDWEYPREGESSGRQYAVLMRYLSDGLKAENMLLTAAVMAGKTPDGTVQYDAAAQSDAVVDCVDWINVMAYDGGDGDRHSSYAFAVDSVNYWKETRGVPAHKIVLGVPFYGRPTWASYDALLQVDDGAASKDIVFYQGSQVHYNGKGTIKRKTDWAIDHLGGIMIWELTQDSVDEKQSLLNAIKREVNAHG